MEKRVKSELESNAQGEKLFSIIEISRAHRITAGRAVRIFEDEPGVLPVKSSFGKKYGKLLQQRIPDSVLQSVLRKFGNLDEAYRDWLRLHRRQHTHLGPQNQTAEPAPDVSVQPLQRDQKDRLYSYNQIAAIMNIGPKIVLHLFRNEPDVLEIAAPRFGRRKGSYLEFSTRRVPEEALRRVRARLTRPADETSEG